MGIKVGSGDQGGMGTETRNWSGSGEWDWEWGLRGGMEMGL